MADAWLAHEAQIRWYALIAVFGAVAVLEARAPRVRITRLGARWGAVAAMVALGALLSRAIFPMLTVGLAAWCQARGVGLLNLIGLPAPAAAVIAVALLDATRYLEHRLMHRIPWLWRLHRVHHSDPDFDCSTALRFHPLDVPVTASMHLAAVLLIGPAPAAMLLYELLFLAAAAWAHANLRIPGSVDHALRRVLVTPALHAVHHSRAPGDANRNFAATLTVWDRLFGTYAIRSARPGPLRFGLDETADGDHHALGWLLRLPFSRTRSRRGAAAVR